MKIIGPSNIHDDLKTPGNRKSVRIPAVGIPNETVVAPSVKKGTHIILLSNY
jgi:hypothetical protein